MILAWLLSLCRLIVEESSTGSDNLEEVFEGNLKRIGRMVAILDNWDRPVYLSRVWTVYEQFVAPTIDVQARVWKHHNLLFRFSGAIWVCACLGPCVGHFIYWYGPLVPPARSYPFSSRFCLPSHGNSIQNRLWGKMNVVVLPQWMNYHLFQYIWVNAIFADFHVDSSFQNDQHMPLVCLAVSGWICTKTVPTTPMVDHHCYPFELSFLRYLYFGGISVFGQIQIRLLLINPMIPHCIPIVSHDILMIFQLGLFAQPGSGAVRTAQGSNRSVAASDRAWVCRHRWGDQISLSGEFQRGQGMEDGRWDQGETSAKLEATFLDFF